MKKPDNRSINYSFLFFIFCFPFCIISCDSYNFSVPQPADRENIYEFPEVLRGTWISEEGDDEFIYISKHYASMISSGKEKIVKGVWPVPDAKGNFINLPNLYKSFYTVRYDSLKNPIDTFSNYLLDGNKIYKVNEEGKLGIGNNYQLDKDTIILLKNEVVTIDMGRNAFLRKLNNEFYVFNFLNSILGTDNPWWQISIIQIKPGKQLVIWDCTEKLKKHASMFYNARGTGNYYFNSSWTTSDIMALMAEGKFEISSELNPVKKKK
jgi:hypothetical protein